MKKITISKMKHRGELRIKLTFVKNQDWINRIKTIEGRKWSATKRCWHLPYSTDIFSKLKSLFDESQIEILKAEVMASEKVLADTQDTVLETTENEALWAFAKWNVQDTPVQLVEYQLGEEIRKKVVGVKIIAKKVKQEWIAFYVPADKKGWINVLRNINGRKWNVENSCWLLPNVKASFRQLKQYIGLNYVIFDFVIDKDIPDYYVTPSGKYQKSAKIIIKTPDRTLLNELQQQAVYKLEEQLTLRRYSTSTLRVYKTSLIGLFLFFEKLEPEQISPKDVEAYLLHCIRIKKIAVSTQNQIINAYKFYVEKVVGRSKQWIEMPRPKKPKKLPNVLSELEVTRLLNAQNNIKHKLILLIIYSGGLRLSEVVNLKVRDINIERRTIQVKNAKGQKDRVVALGDNVVPFLQKYLKIYSPTNWLFEGQYGGQYSKRSVQSVFYQSMERAKISSYATVHTLRHSFATHCIENGYSVALVQKALGHQSIKTTETYLHVSSEVARRLKSPVDKLKFD